MGIRNELAYKRQLCLGDVNCDGRLDIAIGGDNIGNATGGVPDSQPYVFQPNGERFESGKFEDVVQTDLLPDFGGFHHDSARDKAGPDINLCDWDKGGNLALLQCYHCDVRAPLLPYSPGQYRPGVFRWKNLLTETGQLKFAKVTDKGRPAKQNYARTAASKCTRASAALREAPIFRWLTWTTRGCWMCWPAAVLSRRGHRGPSMFTPAAGTTWAIFVFRKQVNRSARSR
jgi:hypothetical protein